MLFITQEQKSLDFAPKPDKKKVVFPEKLNDKTFYNISKKITIKEDPGHWKLRIDTKYCQVDFLRSERKQYSKENANVSVLLHPPANNEFPKHSSE